MSGSGLVTGRTSCEDLILAASDSDQLNEWIFGRKNDRMFNAQGLKHYEAVDQLAEHPDYLERPYTFDNGFTLSPDCHNCPEIANEVIYSWKACRCVNQISLKVFIHSKRQCVRLV